MEKSKQDYIFECENGTVYGIPKDKKCCLICKHCTSMLYDYTNGPYMFNCEMDEDTDECENCESFELQEGTLTVGEYEEKINSPEHKQQQKEFEEHLKELQNDKEFQEKYLKLLEQAFMEILSNAPKLPEGFISKAFGKEN